MCACAGACVCVCVCEYMSELSEGLCGEIVSERASVLISSEWDEGVWVCALWASERVSSVQQSSVREREKDVATEGVSD